MALKSADLPSGEHRHVSGVPQPVNSPYGMKKRFSKWGK